MTRCSKVIKDIDNIEKLKLMIHEPFIRGQLPINPNMASSSNKDRVPASLKPDPGENDSSHKPLF